jgi:hypothetical protein
MAPLCVVRRTRSMDDLERRLQHAVVAYVGGDRPAVTCGQVAEALYEQLGIMADRCSVHPYQPEDFLIVLASADLRRSVLAQASIDHAGFSLFLKPWTRLAQASKVIQRTRVQLIMEGVPPHAWDRETTEELLGTSCVVEELAPATRSRSDLALFRLSAWTENWQGWQGIPPARVLAIPEPEEMDAHAPVLALRHREEVSTLRYKVLIHVDSVEEDWLGGKGAGPHGGNQDGQLPQERMGDGGSAV